MTPALNYWSGPRLAVALLLAIIAGGTAGYMVIEGWGAWDAFFMTVTTVATVGYREVHALSRTGQAFTALLIAGGVDTAFYTATLIATLIVEGGLHRRFEQRRFSRILHDLKDHFIVCGAGRIGFIISAELRQQSVPFIVVDRDPERVHQALERGWLAVEADASQEEVLKRVGIHRARRPRDLAVSDWRHAHRADGPLSRRRRFRAAGDQLGASRTVDGAGAGAGPVALAGKSLVDAGIRQKYGVIIVAITRDGGIMEFNPAPESVIRGGDQLVVLGQLSSVKKTLEETVHA